MLQHDTDNVYEQASLPYQPRHPQPVLPPAEKRPSGAASSQRSTPASPRLSKAQALTLVGVFKKSLVVASLLCFGALSGLALSHPIGVATSQTPGVATSPVAPTPSQDDGNGFFKQSQGGYGFGSNTPVQGPVSNSGVS